MEAKQSRRELVKNALPGSLADVMTATGLGRTTVWRWLKDLHGAGEVHIIAWSRTAGGGPFMPTYAAGLGADKRCTLKPFTEKQKAARHRKAARKDGRWEVRNARVRARYAADRASFQKDPLLAGLFGGIPKTHEG